MKQFSLAQTAAELVQTGGRMLAAGLVAGHDGNISVRLNEQEILVTPAGKSKGVLGPSDLLLVDLQGRVQSRTYHKVLDSGEAEERTAYEVSIMRLLSAGE